MNRQPNHRFAPAIAEALRVTRRFRPYIGVPDFLCGVDPLFAGLHRYETTHDGRSYRDTACCVYVHHQGHMPADRRRTTIALPQPLSPRLIVHELGHVLHERLRFEPNPAPVTRYAATNRFEAFAEAFTSYLYYGHGDYPDPATAALLDAL